MAATRLDLQAKLEMLYKQVYNTNTAHVYFAPNENTRMVYPCIVYEYGAPAPEYADNKVYLRPMLYKWTVVDPFPDAALGQPGGMAMAYAIQDNIANVSINSPSTYENLYHFPGDLVWTGN